MNIIKEKTVSFTGYRQHKIKQSKPYTDDLMTRISDEVYGAIKSLYEKQGYTTFLSGMAEGFDMLSAEAVLKLKKIYPEIKLIAVIPFQGQESSYDSADKITYTTLYNNADRVIYVSEYYYNGVFLKRNDFLLENSSHLLCFYNGLRGGTMYTYNRAVKRNFAITNIFDQL